MKTSTLINTEYKEYAKHTVEHRAIPNLMDGLKPVHRFLVYAVNRAGAGMHKNADIAGRVSGYGYEHGETSAQDALALMAANWNNQIPIFNQHGTFGSRLVQKPAAARYIFVSKKQELKEWFKEENAVFGDDPDILCPKFYLPPVPWVLVNGSHGIAVGFATLILPRTMDSIKKAIRAILDGKKVPFFETSSHLGGCVYGDSENPKRFIFEGTIDSIKKSYSTWKVKVSDLPYGYDRSKYFKKLQELQDAGKIEGFEDNSGKSAFAFTVIMNDAQKKQFDADMFGYLKLRKIVVENLTVIDHEGKIRVFESVEELLRAWVSARLDFYEKEKTQELAIIDDEIAEKKAMCMFIERVNQGTIKLEEIESKSHLIMTIENHLGVSKAVADKMSQIPTYKFTVHEIEKLEGEVEKLEKERRALASKTLSEIFKERMK